MAKNYRSRIGIVVVLTVLIALVYAGRLFYLQLVPSAGGSVASGDGVYTYTRTVTAARGEILDRHGTVLVSNRASYNVELNNVVVNNADDPNALLLTLAKTCEKNGIEYQDGLPLSDYPYSYTMDDVTSADRYYFKEYMLAREWDADMTAGNLANKLKDAFDISPDYTEAEVRIILGLRYELSLRAFTTAPTYVVAEDVSAENLAILKELGIPGMEVVTSTVREYNTECAAHVLGHVGLMTEEEYTTYKDQGYSMDATVGKDGAEAAFERYLHGSDGTQTISVASDGAIVDETWDKEAESGNNVILSLDIGLQEVAEDALAKRIKEMATTGQGDLGDGKDANAGACIVMDVTSGEVLACANYPTYTTSQYENNYEELVKDENNPLYNRALMGAYQPGSTFKMITALAGLRSGVIDETTTINAQGVYRAYSDYQPKCWLYTSRGQVHNDVNVRTALAASCNIFFYSVGDWAGIRPLDEVAASFGVGQPTGSELTESVGQMASPELRAELYAGTTSEEWHAADTLMSAIGQSDTTMTPLQLCRYVATIANGGSMYNATFLRRVVSSDFQSLIKDSSAVAVATNLVSSDEWTILHDGMFLCTTDADRGTAYQFFEDYEIPVCAKTGTAQHGSGGSDNGAFVCWAPADDPQIAIAVYVEHGATGGFYSEVAKAAMNYYFDTQDQAQTLDLENQAVTN